VGIVVESAGAEPDVTFIDGEERVDLGAGYDHFSA
jgi:D-alanyl-D-alanine dipeptidase